MPTWTRFCIFAERTIQHGPVFTQEPCDSVFPLSSEDNKIFINCKAKGNPPPYYRWKFNEKDLSTYTNLNYSLLEGNLLINNPQAMKDGGSYQCIATNAYGTILSRKAKVEFAYLQNFTNKARNAVSVREGQAVVLLCSPPPHFGGIVPPDLLLIIFFYIKIVQDAKKNPQTTSRDIQAALEKWRCCFKEDNKEVLEHKSPAWSSCQEKAISAPMPQKGPLSICQTAPRQASQPLEQSHLKTKIELYSHNPKHYVCRGVNKTYGEKYTIPTVKHVGGSLIFWGFVSSNGTGKLVKIDRKINAASVMGEYEPKIEVQFDEMLHVLKGTSVRLECFALGNPVPSISWRRADGSPFLGKMKINQANGVLEIPYFQPEDAGFYECVAENSRGHSVVKGHLIYNDVEHMYWAQILRDAYMAIDADLHWECRANGKPQPVYRWLKNGQAMVSEDRIHINGGTFMLSKVNLADSGMYQCLAENKHSVIYASAELKVVASPPDFSKVPVKKSTLVQRGGEVIIECQPHASPKPSFSWRKEGNLLKNNKRRTISEDGTLRIANVSESDAGRYTCVACNLFGVSSSTGTLVVIEPTKITVPPLSMDVTVGESIVLPCRVSRGSNMDLIFKWFFNGKLVDFSLHKHFEMIGGGASGDLMLRNIQLKHSGKYVCIVHTMVDSVSAAADLIVRGPPGCPERILVGEVTPQTVQLSWSPSPDNHSPITHYIVQDRSDFSIGWQAVKTAEQKSRAISTAEQKSRVTSTDEQQSRATSTDEQQSQATSPDMQYSRVTTSAPLARKPPKGGGETRGSRLVSIQTDHYTVIIPDSVPGQMTRSIAVGLRPWVQYEFRVAAINSVGVGEPSAPSEAVLTNAAVPEVAPASVRGGGGSRGELVIVWEPVPEDLQNGEDFGYVVAFRLLGSLVWMQSVVPSVDASHYVFKNDSIPPVSQFEVKVGVYNSIGEGPFSPVFIVYSAEEEPSIAPTKVWAHSISSSELQVFWDPIPPNHNKSTISGYEVLLWEEGSLGSKAIKERVKRSPAYITGLKSSTMYLISVRAHNSGGVGPASAAINMTTKKPPPNQPPGNIGWNLKNSKLFLHWQHVKAMDNESEVTGYKVMYRQNWQRGTSMVETNQTSLELTIPSGEDLLIQIKASSDGGDGSYSSPVHIPKVSSKDSLIQLSIMQNLAKKLEFKPDKKWEIEM
ncbi:hypothetical protein QTP86_019738, partial [Hemibagrus guttatus]